MPPWKNSMKTFALKVLKEIKKDNWELSILLCGDKTITELNSRYRNKNEPTDILSFNMGCEIDNGGKKIYLSGDIVISLDTLSENSGYFKISEDEELRRLVIHGILHLDGMDHETLDKKETMLLLQEDILSALKDEHIFPNIESGGKK